MLVLLILGAAALLAAVVLALLHLVGLAVVLAVVGAIAILVALFRRFGRRGDFSRSGWSG